MELFEYYVQSFRGRKRAIAAMQQDLEAFGAQEGYTEAQVATAVSNLYSAFVEEWGDYIVTGSNALATAIQNDVTLGWLDTAVGQSTVRDQLIARL